MNWKLIIVGGLAYYIAAFIVSFASGALIHEGVLDAAYTATSNFWRPELRQDRGDHERLEEDDEGGGRKQPKQALQLDIRQVGCR